jgi:MFS family permease
MQINQHSSAKPRFFYGYVIVLATFVIMGVMWGSFYSFGVFFNPLLEEFGWTRAMTSGAFSLSLVVLSSFIIVVGKLNDRFGPRVIMSVSGFGLGIGYILVSQINTSWQLYLYYGVLIGASMSAAFIPMVSSITRWFVKRRGMMTGIATSGLGAGILITPLIANWLVTNYGWRFSYVSFGVAVLVIVISMAQLLRSEPDKMGQVPYGADDYEGNPSSQSTGISLRQGISIKQFWMLAFSVGCFAISLGTVMVHIVPHAIGLGISAVNAASVLSVVGGAGTASRVIMGSACDRIGNKLALTLCFVFLLGSVLVLLVAKELWLLYIFAVMFAFAYGGISTVMSPIIAELFGLVSHGAILGMMSGVFGEGGSAVGSVLSGYIFDVTGGYQVAFLLCLALSIIGLSLIMVIKPIRL